MFPIFHYWFFLFCGGVPHPPQHQNLTSGSFLKVLTMRNFKPYSELSYSIKLKTIELWMTLLPLCDLVIWKYQFSELHRFSKCWHFRKQAYGGGYKLSKVLILSWSSWFLTSSNYCHFSWSDRLIWFIFKKKSIDQFVILSRKNGISRKGGQLAVQ